MVFKLTMTEIEALISKCFYWKTVT